jgi:hypothetical protein
MAGNIIPAIATTNAIIAGVIMMQALHLLGKNYSGIRNVHLQRKPEVPLSSVSIDLPSRECGVCADTYIDLMCDPEHVTLAEAVGSILGPGPAEGEGSHAMDACVGSGACPRDVSVYEDKRLLADPEFVDNADRTLASLSVTHGKFLIIVDEDGEYETVAAAILPLPYVHNFLQERYSESFTCDSPLSLVGLIIHAIARCSFFLPPYQSLRKRSNRSLLFHPQRQNGSVTQRWTWRKELLVHPLLRNELKAENLFPLQHLASSIYRRRRHRSRRCHSFPIRGY